MICSPRCTQTSGMFRSRRPYRIVGSVVATRKRWYVEARIADLGSRLIVLGYCELGDGPPETGCVAFLEIEGDEHPMAAVGAAVEIIARYARQAASTPGDWAQRDIRWADRLYQQCHYTYARDAAGHPIPLTDDHVIAGYQDIVRSERMAAAVSAAFAEAGDSGAIDMTEFIN